MAPAVQTELEVHGRRAPRRSRYGCRNCKLRKLKCDESKPHCKRCLSFGVMCNSMSVVPDLQPIAVNTEAIFGAKRKIALQPPITSAIWSADKDSSFELNPRSQDFITRYFGSCLITPDDPNTKYLNRKLLELSFDYPFLMHASLAVAYTYDRYINKPKDYHRSLEECYHWSQSTTLLNHRLKDPIGTKERDPIWGTAAALAILSFASPDACTPEESWPLKSSQISELNWLHMSKGKNSLWNIVDPLRPDSIFHVMVETFGRMFSPLPESGIDGMSRELAAICGLEDSSTAKNNSYFYAAHAVSRILDLPDDEVSMGDTQIFTMRIHDAFESLLREKDPVALLLLYLWYRKAGRSIWWIELRARVECPSICSYLRLDKKSLAEIKSICQEMNWALGRLLFLSVSLPVELQDRFAHLTGILDHHHIGDIMTVLSMVEQALKTGNAPPEVLPTPLLNRCHEYWQNSSLEIIQKRDLIRDKNYRKFCVAVSSYLKFLSAIDDLVLVVKGSLGECHIISKELPESLLTSDLSMENGRSGGL